MEAYETEKISLIHFTPFADAKASVGDTSGYLKTASASEKDTVSHPGPFCYLLEIDNAKILLDVGIRINKDGLDADHLEMIKQVDAILCTHAALEHIGGLVYLMAGLSLNQIPPIYMTVAAMNIANILFMDTLQNYISVQPAATGGGDGFAGADDSDGATKSQGWSLSNVKNVLHKMIGLRYSQPIHLHGKAEGITIMAYPAGHTLGGAYWKIRKGTEDLVYAVKFNHKKERHLDGCALTSLNYRPSVMITDATNVLSVHHNRKHRDSEFMDTIISTLRAGGNVLIPVDPVGRLLEILLLLDAQWSLHKFPYGIYLLSSQGVRLFDYVKSMMEWMGESIGKSFASNRENPFDLKHVKFLNSLEEYSSLMEDQSAAAANKSPLPKVILATNANLEFGFARRLFSEWTRCANHTVIFTSCHPPFGTLPYELLTSIGKSNQKAVLSFKMYEKVALEGSELALYKKDKETKEKASIEKSQKKIKEDVDAVVDYSESSDSDTERPSLSVDPKTEIAAKESGRHSGASLWAWNQRRTFDYYMSEGELASPQETRPVTFPQLEVKRSWTPYGEPLNPAEWPEFEFLGESKKETTDNMMDLDVKEEGFDLAGDLKSAIHNLQKLSKEDEDGLFLGQHVKAEAERKPCKVVETEYTGPVECSIKWMDFEGLSDGRSLKTLFQLVQPMKLVLVHGEWSALEYLCQASKLVLVKGRSFESDTRDEDVVGDEDRHIVIANTSFQRLNISVISNMFQIKFSDALLKSLKLKKKDDYGLAKIHGLVKWSQTDSKESRPADARMAAEEPALGGFVPMAIPVLDAIGQRTSHNQAHRLADLLHLKYESLRKQHDLEMRSECPAHPGYLFIGDLRLPELKRKLQAKRGDEHARLSNATFQYDSGKLVVSEHFFIGKQTAFTMGPSAPAAPEKTGPPAAGTEWVMEGLLSREYYHIRDTLYDCFVRL